jgi:hypothetical protein
MSKRGKIPIAEAQRIAEKFGAPIVIVFSIHDGGNSFNVISYGQSKALCRHAASLGDQIAQKVLNGEISPVTTQPMNLPDVPMEWDGKKTLE